MTEVTVPGYRYNRRRTRNYDRPPDNTQEQIAAIVTSSVPAGVLIPTLLDSQPDGGAWLLCDGSTILETEYPTLFDIIGGTLPDLRGKTVMGAAIGQDLFLSIGSNSVTLSEAQLPTHSHAVTDPGHTHTLDDPGHDHSVTDPGHDHTVTDPGHSHTAAEVASGSAEGDAGNPVDGAAAGNTGDATTGITVDNTGGSEAIDITPAAITVNWLIKT